MQDLYKQLLKVSRRWRDIKAQMQSGLGHKQEEDSPADGSMAVFCPACPQPGVNLPEDWKERYTPYVVTNCIIPVIAYQYKVTNSSALLSWMETSQQSI
jgi:hypothetical protein